MAEVFTAEAVGGESPSRNLVKRLFLISECRSRLLAEFGPEPRPTTIGQGDVVPNPFLWLEEAVATAFLAFERDYGS